MDKIQPINHLISQTQLEELSDSDGLILNQTFILIISFILLFLPLFIGLIINSRSNISNFTRKTIFIAILIICWGGAGSYVYWFNQNKNHGIKTVNVVKNKQYLIYNINNANQPYFTITNNENNTKLIKLDKNTQLNIVDKNQPEKLITKTTFEVPKVTDPNYHINYYKAVYQHDNKKSSNKHYRKYHAKQQHIIVNVHKDHYQELKEDQNQ